MGTVFLLGSWNVLKTVVIGAEPYEYPKDHEIVHFK